MFIGVVTTFLRAIRAGVIHFRHAATILAHYGRLGPTFDLCSKVIVEILREAGPGGLHVREIHRLVLDLRTNLKAAAPTDTVPLTPVHLDEFIQLSPLLSLADLIYQAIFSVYSRRVTICAR